MNWRHFQNNQKVMEIADQFISYVDKGDGEPVVLIHGIPTWGYLWHQQLEPLAQAFRVLVPDLLGFGFSSKSDCFSRSIERQAIALDAWLDNLGIEHAHIVGHDIGGGVALRLAASFPARVSTLSLLNSVCYDSWPVEMMLQLGHPRVNGKFSACIVQKMLRVALRGGFYHQPSHQMMQGILAPYATEVGKLSLIRSAAALDTSLTQEITAWLHRITAPCLVLWGDDDSFQKPKYADRLGRDLPNAEVVHLDHARHFLMLDKPNVVQEKLRNFIAQHRALRPAVAI